MTYFTKLLLVAFAGIIASNGAQAAVEFHMVLACSPGLARFPSHFSGETEICVSPDLIMNDANIIRVDAVQDKYLGGKIRFVFDDAAQSKLAVATQDHLGGRIAVVVDGHLATAVMIISPILGREMELIVTEPDRSKILALFQDRKLVK